MLMNLILILKSADELQKAISILEKFCNDWLLSINPKKTKVMVFLDLLSRPLGERNEPCLAVKRPPASDEVAIWNPTKDFSIGKSGFRFWKSKSGFPNRTHPYCLFYRHTQRLQNAVLKEKTRRSIFATRRYRVNFRKFNTTCFLIPSFFLFYFKVQKIWQR